MKEWTIGSFAELLDVPARAKQVFPDTDIWYRGEECHKWQLLPRVHRPRASDKGYTRDAEASMAHGFQLAALSRYPNCPRKEDLHLWLVLMQHYGLPTRLLDWSESLLVAAYFATSYKRNNDTGVIWVLAPHFLNRSQGRAHTVFPLECRSHEISEPRPATLGLVAGAFGGYAEDNEQNEGEVLAVVPPQVDLRVLVQQSVFTLHGSEAGPLDALWDKANGTKKPVEERSHEFLAKCIISAQGKGDIAAMLKALNIRRSTVFPDLGNLSADLIAQYGG